MVDGVWLSPRTGCFGVMVILGEKAMQAARQIKLPRRIVQTMNDTLKYAEGTGIRLEVKSRGKSAR